MDKNLNKSEDQFVQRLLEIFGDPNPVELKKDLDKAFELKEKSKFINTFLKNYSNAELDEKTCKKMLSEIISKLVNSKPDFVNFMEIYLTTKDNLEAEVLRQHHILKEERLTKVENGNTNGDTYVKFGISLACIYDLKSYYEKFINGILHYFQLAFKEKYLYEYIKFDYFNNSNKFQYYKENISSLEYSLNNMLIDIYRVISEHLNEIMDNDSKKSEVKMNEIRFKILLVGAHLGKNEEAKSIYKKCKNNNEILAEVDKLMIKSKEDENDELYDNLLLFKDNILNYLQNEKQKLIQKTISKDKEEIYLNLKQIRELRQENNKLLEAKEEANELKLENNKFENKINALETSVNKHEAILKTIEATLKTHEATLKTHEATLKTHEATLKIHEATINELKVKVEFMEPIVLSLIGRKAINHSIIKILENYKKSLKVTLNRLPNNEIKYNITFIDSVNNISKNELNDLIDKIFLKKDKFNEDSHLVKKELPSFIPDLWAKVKQLLELTPKEITAFDAIITNEIKLSFKIGAEDLSIRDYLKNANIGEFGK